MLLQAGCGHFGWTAFEARYMAAFIATAARLRIPAGSYAETAPLTMNNIDLTQGYYTDTTFTGATIINGTFASYTGNKQQAFYHLTPELGQLWLFMHQGQFQKQRQTISTPAYFSCNEAFQTCQNLRLGGTGSGGTFLPMGATASSTLPVRFGTYNGAFEVDGDSVIRLTSVAKELNGQTGWIYIIQEGNAQFQCAERPLRFQVQNATGAAQTVSVGAQADLTFRDTVLPPPFTVAMSASSGLPVEVLIESGALRYEGGQFKVDMFPRGVSNARIRVGQSGNNTFGTATSGLITFTITRTDSAKAPVYIIKPIGTSLMLWPNPAKSYLVFTLNGGEQLAHATLIDVNGKQVTVWTETERGFLPLRNVAPGVYQLLLRTSKGIRKSRVVVE